MLIKLIKNWNISYIYSEVSFYHSPAPYYLNICLAIVLRPTYVAHSFPITVDEVEHVEEAMDGSEKQQDKPHEDQRNDITQKNDHSPESILPITPSFEIYRSHTSEFIALTFCSSFGKIFLTQLFPTDPLLNHLFFQVGSPRGLLHFPLCIQHHKHSEDVTFPSNTKL